MKCDMCDFDELPNNVVRLSEHVNSNHLNDISSEVFMVWRDKNLVLTCDPKKKDTVLTNYLIDLLNDQLRSKTSL